VISNQNVRAAAAAYQEARQLTAATRASLFPTVTASAGATRSRTGVSTTTGQTLRGATAVTTSDLSPEIGASWEPDLWGAVRRQVEADKAAAQSSAALLANAALSAQASLAVDYFALRALDEEKRLYDGEVEAYRRSLDITKNQYAAGTMAQTNVITAETNLLTVEAEDRDLGVMRAQNEHAIALLIGVPPAELTIAPKPFASTAPVAPTDVPSTLLQRRPDIAAAERAMKEENALIGVQVAAYYPTLTLSASYGSTASALNQLFEASTSFWSVGANAAETLLDFGARRARVLEAKAAYAQAVAQYRETVLTAFQGVEDQLAALRIYESEAGLRTEAEKAARLAEQLTINQYKAGTVDYTSVVTAQATALNASVSVIQLVEERQIASVTLIEDLGGGWSTADLPSR
jgi:NodT family efflux transporter outer membrane factor (OMF) lipoprotein